MAEPPVPEPPVTRRPVTWRALLAETSTLLDAPDALRVVQRASGNEGADWLLGLDGSAPRPALAHLDAMVARRRAGEPLQYVLGCWGFRTLDLYLDRRVLIPRPETEQVVEVALGELRRIGGGDLRERSFTVADLGTGSGAIALSLAVEVVTAAVWATDRSTDALAVARANLAGLGRPGARVRLAEGDWFAALPSELAGTLDLVVANPPYVAAHEVLPSEVAAWEPTGALVAGPSGLEAHERIVAEAPRWLRDGGSLVVELAPRQAGAVTDLA
ncbi:MAG: peptide chain release factor N(5)-glutamine methyltransferase, partial [Actinomycetota bacterium]|nr:peptide chain release factor N(5)-glutamine methyltransferase [Actinomycetota bacterium]